MAWGTKGCNEIASLSLSLSEAIMKFSYCSMFKLVHFSKLLREEGGRSVSER